MKGIRAYVFFVMVAAILAVGAAYGEQYPKFPIDYVTSRGDRLVNTGVTVEGIVSQSTVVEPKGMSNIRGEYVLTDDSGMIPVKSTTEPPANGKRLTVRGLVRRGDTGAFFLLQEASPPFWPYPGLYVVLGILVVLAVVLVVLLTKKPSPKRQLAAAHVGPVVQTEPGIVTEPPIRPVPPASGIRCPKCDARNAADARFCEQCRAPLQSAADRPRDTVAPRPSSLAQKRTASVKAVEDEQKRERTIAQLIAVEADGVKYGTEFNLSRERQKIGRSDDMDIQVQDETVSREHAAISFDDGSFVIRDLGSSAGTRVNGQKVESHILADNDEIQLGRTKLVFRTIGTRNGQA